MARDPALLSECRSLVASLRRHPTLTTLHASAEWPALEPRLQTLLGTVRVHPPGCQPGPARDPGRLKAVHWNIEHGNWYSRVETALASDPRLAGADLVTLNEVDLGMARAGNRDVAADLACALGLHAAWAPLFLETTPGRHDDARAAAGQANHESLFGLAILSRWPFRSTRIVELPGPDRIQFDGEGMYGRYIALVALVERPGAPFAAVSVHLEVHRTRAHRAVQMAVLVDALGAEGPEGERVPIVLGGDFNTHTFERGRRWSALAGATVLASWPGFPLRRRLLWPDRGPAREPVFEVLRRAGFEWERFTDHAPTLHLRFARVPEALGPLAVPSARPILDWAERRAHLKLDWFAARGWRGGQGGTARGLDGPGRASDHAPLFAEFW